MSASNPSRIPFEMMAAGLPVVELYKENNIYDLPDEGVLLAEPTPEAIASSIIYLLENEEIANKMSNFGKKYMLDYPLQKGFEQFLKAVDDMINTDYNKMSEADRLYKKQAFKPSEEIMKVQQELISQTPIHIDNHGKIYRFLRRCKNLVRLVINKLK